MHGSGNLSPVDFLRTGTGVYFARATTETPVVEVAPEPTPTPSLPIVERRRSRGPGSNAMGEARGVPSDTEKAACVWCVLNRCDLYGKGIIEVVSAPYQFVGYSPDNPVDEELKALCEDVLARYFAEQAGDTDVGRVLPSDYIFFSGDGKRNHFRNAYEVGRLGIGVYRHLMKAEVIP